MSFSHNLNESMARPSDIRNYGMVIAVSDGQKVEVCCGLKCEDDDRIAQGYSTLTLRALEPSVFLFYLIVNYNQLVFYFVGC